MKKIFSKGAILFFSLLSIGLSFTGCKKQDLKPADENAEALSHRSMNSDEEFRKFHHRMEWKTVWELLQARWATAKYRNLQNAIADGYESIDVVVPNMGHHYRKLSLVDNKFEVTKPEILVYNKHEDGHFELVAVEYAVPIGETPNKAPKGFTGRADVWDRNTNFGLWLLHAWVWYKNPDGVFNPTNPLIHTH